MTERGSQHQIQEHRKVAKCLNVVTTVKPIDAHWGGGGGKGGGGGIKNHHPPQNFFLKPLTPPLGILAKTSSTPPPTWIFNPCASTVKLEYNDRPWDPKNTGRCSEVVVIRGNITSNVVVWVGFKPGVVIHRCSKFTSFRISIPTFWICPFFLDDCWFLLF
jgi:hypothetical protein